MKAEIEQALNAMELEHAKALIDKYEDKLCMDKDFLGYKIIYSIYLNDVKIAKELALKGVRQYPTDGDMNFNLAYVYQMEGNIFEAYKYYAKALYIYGIEPGNKAEDTGVIDIIQDIKNQLEILIDESEKKRDIVTLKKIKKYYDLSNKCFGMDFDSFVDNTDVIGQMLWVADNDQRYFGFYGNIPNSKRTNKVWNIVEAKSELLHVQRGEKYQVQETAETYLLPIAAENLNMVHTFTIDGKEYSVNQREQRHFDYYRVPKGTIVQSQGISYYGNEIPLGHSKDRKKLVLNIFIDGLSQTILESEIDENMPFTKRYFQDGVICDRAYSNGEWTYPSIASYISGLNTMQHMMFHPILNSEIPPDAKLLAEYFKDSGYYTAKIDGDWRELPKYGHSRGIDRLIFQNQLIGSKTEDTITTLIEHLETFKETDQFVWVRFGDLHDIADGYDLPANIQAGIDVRNRTMGDIGSTSVKQKYNINKIAAYKKYARYIDLHLNQLYNYINENYKDDEIIVSLFSDHGQGYLVPDDGHFISKERTNVAFMIKCDGYKFRSEELISCTDYANIICTLAGIPYETENRDSNLPVAFGGEKEREYVISESLHANDPYRITFYAKDYTVYFENPDPVRDDGRFEIVNPEIEIRDMAGNLIDDEKLKEYYYGEAIRHAAPLIIYENI